MLSEKYYKLYYTGPRTLRGYHVESNLGLCQIRVGMKDKSAH